MNAQVFLKATKVDGVYEADPLKHPEARRYEKLSYRRVAHEGLQVRGGPQGVWADVPGRV